MKLHSHKKSLGSNYGRIRKNRDMAWICVDRYFAALADRDKEVEKIKAELEALKASFAEVVEEAAASTEE
jgi:hypothetical protein